MQQELPTLSARLAAQLSREAPYEHVDRVARDAVRIANIALSVRASNAPKPAVARIARIAQRYGARALHNGDAHGMAVGLRFKSGTYSSAADNVMFLAGITLAML